MYQLLSGDPGGPGPNNNLAWGTWGIIHEYYRHIDNGVPSPPNMAETVQPPLQAPRGAQNQASSYIEAWNRDLGRGK